jgi:hypothetical protein
MLKRVKSLETDGSVIPTKQIFALGTKLVDAPINVFGCALLYEGLLLLPAIYGKKGSVQVPHPTSVK